MNRRSLTPPPLGFSPLDGDLSDLIGDSANLQVMIAFHEIGGPEALADWARQNQGEFYTKMFTKLMKNKVEHGTTKGVEDLLSRLDQAERSGVLIEGEVTDVEED